MSCTPSTECDNDLVLAVLAAFFAVRTINDEV